MAKIFRGKEINFLFSQMKVYFTDVYCAKPKSSRNSSQESFIIGRGFRFPESSPYCGGALLFPLPAPTKEATEEQKSLCAVTQYVRCGDLSALNEVIHPAPVPEKKEPATESEIKAESLTPSFKEYLSLFDLP